MPLTQVASHGGSAPSDAVQASTDAQTGTAHGVDANYRPAVVTRGRPGAQPRTFQHTHVHLLTIGLLDTYKRINEHYYEQKRLRQQAAHAQSTAASNSGATGTSAAATAAASSATATAASQNESCDDKDSDYIIIPGEVLNGQYRIERRIGKGSFGQVALATDIANEREVAVKIIKSKKPFTRQAETEIRILQKLNELDNTSEKGCVVRLLDTFMHRNHRCLVFERLSMNLYDLLRNTKFVGVSFDLIRKFARQILTALKFFSQPNVNIIHCDLKPENILLVEPRRSALKVIDFGSSCTTTDKPFVYIQSRFYRSPEVILGCSYSTAIDMWSLGCILIEMHSGVPLYSGQNELEQLHLLVGSKGLPPDEMLKEGKKVSTFFEISEDDSGQKVYKLKELPASQQARRLTPLTVEQALGIAPNSPDSAPYRRTVVGHARPKREPLDKYLEFADLLSKMLTYSPTQRISPEEALNHPFLQMPPTGATVAAATTSASMGPPPMPQSGGAPSKSSRTDPPKRPLSQ